MVSWPRLAGQLGALSASGTISASSSEITARLVEVALSCLDVDSAEVVAVDGELRVLCSSGSLLTDEHGSGGPPGPTTAEALRHRRPVNRQGAGGHTLSVPMMARERCWGAVSVARASEPLAGEDVAACVALADVGAALLVHADDRADARVASQQLSYQAVHDDLTGLPVRSVFLNQTDHALARLARRQDKVAVLFLDLDGLKYANDTFGHQTGDILIKHVVDSVRRVVRPTDLLARIGGDEFVLLIEDVSVDEQVTALAARLIDVVNEPIKTPGGQLLRGSISVGVALCDDAQMRADALISHADAAMYQAKQSGGGRWRLFDPQDYHLEAQRETRRGELRRAIEAGQLELFYQPVFELATRRVCAVEALLRWHHPDLGLLTAAQFLPILGAGHPVMRAISDWVVNEACHQLAEWDDVLGARSPDQLMINMTTADLADESWTQTLTACLANNKVSTDRLLLEITEADLMADPARISQLVDRVRRIGARLAIDDFGTGYSSLGRLTHLPAAMLKVDGSFAATLHSSQASLAVVSAVLLLAHNLQITVVVEGVEDQAALQILDEIGATYAQGFLLGRPEPASAITERLRAPLADDDA